MSFLKVFSEFFNGIFIGSQRVFMSLWVPHRFFMGLWVSHWLFMGLWVSHGFFMGFVNSKWVWGIPYGFGGFHMGFTGAREIGAGCYAEFLTRLFGLPDLAVRPGCGGKRSRPPRGLRSPELIVSIKRY